jgi:hypothetical protein
MASRIAVDVEASGPLWDGRAQAAVTRFLADAQRKVAVVAEEAVHANLGSRLKNPTGRYESNIGIRQVRRDLVVTDDKVIYGPWLEGTSQRNQTTRFKGYRSFRRARATARKLVKPIAQAVLNSYLKQMQ